MNKKLKVLYIQQGNVDKSNMKYYDVLAKNKKLDVNVIVPKFVPKKEGGVSYWRVFTGRYEKRYPDQTFSPDYNIILLKMRLAGKSAHSYKGLFKTLSKLNPDVVQIYDVPWGAVVTQVILWKKLFKKKTKIVLYDFENIDDPHKEEFLYSLFYYKLLQKFNIKNLDGLLAGTKEVENILRKKSFKKPAYVMGNGIDETVFKKKDVSKLRKELGLENSFVIGFSGQFIEQKGILTLIDAASLIKDKNIKLLLIGFGIFTPKIKEYLKKKGLQDKALVVDKKLGPLVADYINCMDVMVIPSETTKYWKEQFGRVNAETMLCEVPAIGSSSGSIPEVLGEAGLIFKEKNPEDLKEKIVKLMNDKELRKKMVKKGKEIALKYYTFDKRAEQTYDFYLRL